MIDFVALAGSFDESAYARFLGMKVEELSAGYARVGLTITTEHRNWKGYIHGGVLMSLADHAFGCAANTVEGRTYIAINFETRFIGAPAVGQRLIAEGRVVHAGRTTSVTEIIMRDERGRLIVTSSGTALAVTPPAESSQK
jgi:acyl-CoA thioesterase